MTAVTSRSLLRKVKLSRLGWVLLVAVLSVILAQPVVGTCTDGYYHAGVESPAVLAGNNGVECVWTSQPKSTGSSCPGAPNPTEGCCPSYGGSGSSVCGWCYQASGWDYCSCESHNPIISYTGTCTSCGENRTSLAADAGLGPSACQWDCAADMYVGSQDVVNTVTTTNPDPSGYVTTLAGSAGTSGDVIGSFADSRFNYPYGIDILPGGSQAVLADRNNMKLKLLDLETESVSTLATLTGNVFDICFDASGDIGYITWDSNSIQQINMANGDVQPFTSISASKAWSCVVSNDGYLVYSDYSAIHEVSISDPSDTFSYASSDGNYLSMVITPDNHIYYSKTDNKIYKIDRSSRSNTPTWVASDGGAPNNEGSASSSTINTPRGLSLSSNGNILYISTYRGIMQINLAGNPSDSDYVTIVAGAPSGSWDTGSTDGANALFNYPIGLDIAPNDAYLLVGEYNNHIVRKVSLGNDIVMSTTTAQETCLTCEPGSESPGGDATTCNCVGGHYRAQDGFMTITETVTNPDSAGLIGEIHAGSKAPEGVATAPDGSYVVIVSTYHHRLHLVDTSDNSFIKSLLSGGEDCSMDASDSPQDACVSLDSQTIYVHARKFACTYGWKQIDKDTGTVSWFMQTGSGSGSGINPNGGCVLTKDGKFIYSGFDYGDSSNYVYEVVVADQTGGNVVNQVQLFDVNNYKRGMDVSQDGNRIYYIDDGYTNDLKVYDKSSSSSSTVAPISTTTWSVKISLDEKFAYVSTNSGVLKVNIDSTSANYQSYSSIYSHSEGPFYSIAMSPDGRYVYTPCRCTSCCYSSQSARTYKISTGEDGIIYQTNPAYTGTCTSCGENRTSLVADAGLGPAACQWDCAADMYVGTKEVVTAATAPYTITWVLEDADEGLTGGSSPDQSCDEICAEKNMVCDQTTLDGPIRHNNEAPALLFLEDIISASAYSGLSGSNGYNEVGSGSNECQIVPYFYKNPSWGYGYWTPESREQYACTQSSQCSVKASDIPLSTSYNYQRLCPCYSTTTTTAQETCLTCEPGSVSVGGNVTSCTCVGGYHRAAVEVVTTGGTAAEVTTPVGSYGNYGYAEGSGADAKVNYPYGIDIHPDGKTAVFADRNNHRIRLYDIETETTTLLAGTGSHGFTNSDLTSSTFWSPMDVCYNRHQTNGVSDKTNEIFVMDYSNNCIRKIDTTTQQVTTLISFYYPRGCVVTKDGVIIVTDYSGIYEYSTTDGSNIANYNSADYAYKVSLNLDETKILYGDANSKTLKAVVRSTGNVESLGSQNFQNGGTTYLYSCPHIVPDGTHAYIGTARRIEKIDWSDYSISIFAGSPSQTTGHADGIGTDAIFYGIEGTSLSPDGTFLLVADAGGHNIRKVVTDVSVTSTAYTGTCTSCGSGYTSLASEANTGGPDICFYDCPAGEYAGTEDGIGQVYSEGGVVTTLPAVSGSGTGFTNNDLLAYGGNTLYRCAWQGYIIESVNQDTGVVTSVLTMHSSYHRIIGMSVSPDNADKMAVKFQNTYSPSTYQIRIVYLSTGDWSTVPAGEPTYGGSTWVHTLHSSSSNPNVIWSRDGNMLFYMQWSTTFNTRAFCKMVIAGPTETCISMNEPYDFAATDTHVYVADSTGHRIVKVQISDMSATILAGDTTGVTSSGSYETEQGRSTNSGFAWPQMIEMTNDGLYAIVAERAFIRKVDVSTGETSVLAGDCGCYVGNRCRGGRLDGSGTSATLNQPMRGTKSSDGSTLFFADTRGYIDGSCSTDYSNRRIRKVTLPGMVTGVVQVDTCLACPPKYSSDAKSRSQNDCFCPAGEYDGLEYVTVTTVITNPDVEGTTTTPIGSVNSGGPCSSEGAVGNAATFKEPTAVIGLSNNLAAVADPSCKKVFLLNLNDNSVTTLVGTGSSGTSDHSVGSSATLNYPFALCKSPSGDTLYIVDNSGQNIRVVDMTSETYAVTTLAVYSGKYLTGCAVTSDGLNMIIGYNGGMFEVAISDPTTTLVTYSGPWENYGVTLSADDTTIFYTQSNYLYKLTRGNANSNTVWSSGYASSLGSILISADGTFAYVQGFVGIWKVQVSNGDKEQLVGNDVWTTPQHSDTAGSETFYGRGMTMDYVQHGMYFLIADVHNEVIRKVSTGVDGVVTTTTPQATCFTCPPNHTSPARSTNANQCFYACDAGEYAGTVDVTTSSTETITNPDPVGYTTTPLMNFGTAYAVKVAVMHSGTHAVVWPDNGADNQPMYLYDISAETYSTITISNPSAWNPSGYAYQRWKSSQAYMCGRESTFYIIQENCWVASAGNNQICIYKAELDGTTVTLTRIVSNPTNTADYPESPKASSGCHVTADNRLVYVQGQYNSYHQNKIIELDLTTNSHAETYEQSLWSDSSSGAMDRAYPTVTADDSTILYIYNSNLYSINRITKATSLAVGLSSLGYLWGVTAVGNEHAYVGTKKSIYKVNWNDGNINLFAGPGDDVNSNWPSSRGSNGASSSASFNRPIHIIASQLYLLVSPYNYPDLRHVSLGDVEVATTTVEPGTCGASACCETCPALYTSPALSTNANQCFYACDAGEYAGDVVSSNTVANSVAFGTVTETNFVSNGGNSNLWSDHSVLTFAGNDDEYLYVSGQGSNTWKQQIHKIKVSDGTPTLVHDFGSGYQIQSLEFSPIDSNVLAVGYTISGWDNRICFLDIAGGTCNDFIATQPTVHRGLAFTPDASKLVYFFYTGNPDYINKVCEQSVTADGNELCVDITGNHAPGDGNDLAVTPDGNYIIFTVKVAHRVFKITRGETLTIDYLAGLGSWNLGYGDTYTYPQIGNLAPINNPQGVVIEKSGTYAIVNDVHRVLKINIETSEVDFVAGGCGYYNSQRCLGGHDVDGVGENALLSDIKASAITPDGTFIYVMDKGSYGPSGYEGNTADRSIRKISLGPVTTSSLAPGCLTCPTGRTSPALSTSADACGCLAGTYEDGPNCAQCPADNTSPFGSTSVDECACAPGFTGPKESCTACNPGYYKSTAGSSACDQCDAALHESTSTLYGFTSCSCKEGYFRNTNDLCEACVSNEYKDHVGNDDCTECTTNSETAGTGASAANQCLCSKGYENTEANTESMPSCQACDLGEYKESASNILACVDCPTDSLTLHTASFTVTDCQCVAGHEGVIATDTDTCADCDAGTFKSNTGTQDCGACPTGATSPSSSTASTDCTCTNTGYTGPNGGPCECAAGYTGENCEACAVNTFKSTTGDAACTPCSSDSSSPSGSTASTDCTCNAGFTGADGGPCNACNANEYKPTTGSAGCTGCPTNTVSPSGSDAIEDCVAAAGWYGTSTTTITQCPDNTNSVEGATVVTDCTCNVGYTGPDGGVCTACSEGEYKNTQGNAACTSCGGVAFYSPEASDSSDDCVCALGYTGDGTSCSACETGTYKTTTGSAACTPCDSDASSPSASTAASDCDCNVGFFGDGHTTCDACGAGTYQDVSGSTDCKDCTANSNSAQGSDESTDCVCNEGYAGAHGGPCVVCTAGQYEDTATHICQNCPDNSHSSSGSTLTDCLCNAGYTGPNGGPCSACNVGQYKDLTGSSACLSCDAQATSPAGSTSSGCACLPGYTGDGVSCSECLAGKFKDTTDNVACTPCPANSQSADAASVCLCNLGFTGPADSCSQCGAGTYKSTTGTDACTGCPENTHSPVQSDEVTDCVCNAGYTGPDGLACLACETDEYKPLTGSGTCTACPSFSASPAASTATTDCVCNAGYGGDDGGPCTQCLAGTYENTATNTCTNCPLNTNSPVGSDEVFDCFCLKGHTGGNGGDCAPCYENYYKDTTGSASCTPCMDFSTSPAGSDDVSDCVCNTGYHLAGDGTCDLECAAGYEAGIHELQCLQCPNGKYKEEAGDHSCRNCPAHSSHTRLNATSVDVCVCFHGYYKAVDGETCNACETGKFNNQAGEGQCFDCFSDTSGSCVSATGTQTECPDLCQAPAGYQVTASGVNLEPCPVNTYNDGSLTTCQTCPSPSTYTSSTGSTSVSDCICQPGHFRDNGVCTACAQGSYKSETGDAACDLCTATDSNTNTLATASTSVSDCLCIANYEIRDGSCQACPAGGAKHILGNDACIDCTDFATLADNGVHAASSCLCDPGYTGNHLGCSACLQGQYKSTSGPDLCSDCVEHATTATTASDSISDCYCPPPLWEDGDPGPTDPSGSCVSSCDPGTFKGESACENCIEGTYKPDTGPHACTPCSLPRNASAAGSDSVDDCSCGAGEMGLAGEHTVIQSIGALSEAGLDVQTFTSSSTIPDTNKRYKSLQLTSAIDVTVSITSVVIFKCTTDCDSFGVISLYNLPGQLQLTMTSGTATITQYTRREVVVTHTPSWYNAAAAEALTLQEDLRAGDFLFNPATAVFSTTVCVTCAPGVVCKPFI